LKGLTTQLSPTLQTFMQWTLQSFAFVEEDRPLQTELQQIVNRLDQLELFNQPEFMG
ncbi:histidine ammonia-lyase, partial [Acinetobacter baumannii]